MKRKLAFVVQRYGMEVNGGAETLSRELVEHLNDEYEVEVLTTKALEYTTWEDYYTADVEQLNGVAVRRFGVEKPRDIKKFGRFCGKVLDNPNHTQEQEDKWFDMQGPETPALVNYIDQHQDDYCVFIFMTYLYYTSVMGLTKVAKKAILIPTAHDEPPIYLRRFEELFHMPKALFYLTHEEQEFVEKKFHNEDILNNSGFGGSGIEVPDNPDKQRILKEHNITDYIVYAGRVDQSKGCAEMFKFFLKYKRRHKGDLKLVLIGKPVIRIPHSRYILSLGFVSEECKYDVMAGAKMLIMPSPFESLSIVVLESLALSVPILCNGKCEVLKGHCERSKAGLYYHNYNEFETELDTMLASSQLRAEMGERGKAYVSEYYTWDKVKSRFVTLIEQVIASEDATEGTAVDAVVEPEDNEYEER